jgi:hypothetical protein
VSTLIVQQTSRIKLNQVHCMQDILKDEVVFWADNMMTVTITAQGV